ncbi:MAG: ParM/StbA family protein [Desulfobacterales bacterium]|nr:ParM/StbA family protein [Desulfobacterales bacterium]
MNNKKNYNIGIDIGFGDTKAFAFGPNGNSKKTFNKISFPSALAYASSNYMGLESEKKYLSFKNKKYITGEEAINSKEIIPNRDISFLLEHSELFLFTSIQLLSQKYNMKIADFLNSSEKICVGLPLDYWKSYKDILSEKLNTFEIKKGDEHFSINFKKVHVMPQGLGIHFDMSASQNKFSLKDKNILYVDIGFETVDILCVLNGIPTQDYSDMIESGGVIKMCSNLNDYLKLLKKQNYRGCSEQDLKKILKEKKISNLNETYDLTEAVNDIQNKYSEFLFRHIKTKYKHLMMKLDYIVIAGGGKYYITDKFIDEFPEGAVLFPQEPEYSNAKGFCYKSMGC